MVNFSDLAIFVLATTTRNGRNDNLYATYYESRITPISMTWARYYPHVYFVFGTNSFDYKFLSEKCELTESYPPKENNQRILRPSSPQQLPENRNYLYNCPVSYVPYNNFSSYYYHNESQTTSVLQHSFQALYIGNCTGEYFGSGPTCRCQESIRYFLANKLRFSTVQWFAFMDDDNYIRPHLTINILNEISLNSTYENIPMGVIASTKSAGVKNIRLKLANGTYVPLSAPCVDLLIDSFFYAQPAFLNRLALRRLQPMVDANGFTSLQSIWGGSHDSVLGMALWMHEIRLLSLATAYCGTVLTVEYLQQQRSTSKQIKWRDNLKDCMMFHRVLNFRFPVRVTKKLSSGADQKVTVYKHYASQFHIAKLLGEDIWYTTASSNKTLTIPISSREISIQKQLATKIVQYMTVQLRASSLNESPFPDQYPDFPREYHDFLPAFCMRKIPPSTLRVEV